MADLEKSGVTTLERTISDESTTDERLNSFTEAEKKKLIWRIDVRLVLTLGFMYCVSLMDRTNLGIAVVAGMGVDLKLIGFRYSTLVLVFFITYVALQPPATVILRRVGPRIFLPTITILWGATMVTFAFIKEWQQMIPLRLVLGIFEAGFFPGCAYLLSCWYPRYELQKRYAVFYLIGSLSSAFSGVLAYGFSKMAGLGNLGPDYGQHYGPTKANPTAPSGIMSGISGWRWIFIMQGLITCAVAVIGAFTIADFPEKASKKSKSLAVSFLNEREANFIVARIEEDRHDAIAEPFKLSTYLRCGLDSKIWGFATLFMLTTTTTYAIAYFLPIILHEGMGYSAAMAECLIAPPYIVAAIWMFGCAWYGDKNHIRGPIVIVNAVLGLIGLPLLGFATSPAARYFGVFLATTSCNANVPAILSFQANNIRGQWKRAFASATLVGAGGIGGIIGSTVFRSSDKPGYKPGIYTTMIACGGVVIITAFMMLKFNRANKRAAAGGKVIEGLSGFRYTL
ncbi:putative major facilitator superfamily, MFS transporter superfamily [Septoria linicola]|nr:putative major facilitator superfamily, MFS transporter superfamily [Septoria linicola]